MKFNLKYYINRERLLENKYWNSAKFGGPFSCLPQADGSYREYVLPNPSYFVNKDFNYNECEKNSNGECKCEYYSEKRIFPIVWRCRPWFLASSSNSYM